MVYEIYKDASLPMGVKLIRKGVQLGGLRSLSVVATVETPVITLVYSGLGASPYKVADLSEGSKVDYYGEGTTLSWEITEPVSQNDICGRIESSGMSVLFNGSPKILVGGMQVGRVQLMDFHVGTRASVTIPPSDGSGLPRLDLEISFI